MHQLAFPSHVSIAEIQRERSLGGAIDLCAKVAGLEPKQLQEALKSDKAQFSRWTSGSEGVIWPKFEGLMDACGNDAPLLWMLNARGYDLTSVRRLETETERRLRIVTEERDALKRVLQGTLG